LFPFPPVHADDGDQEENVFVLLRAREQRRAGQGRLPRSLMTFVPIAVGPAGEPLNAEAVWWGKRVLGLPIHDNWWQTETGGIMIANTPAFDIKPGSMGRPLPGVGA
jgi:acyl-coenzyme A synthetase/AMP-(fatty) acid ligase